MKSNFTSDLLGKKHENMNAIKKHLASYPYAFRGIWLAFRHERNMIFHMAAALVVLLLNYLLHVSRTDWLITLMLIGMAWMSEIFNTAIEKLADRVSANQDPLIGQAKDLAAGAVLILCLIAVVCGVIVYLPYVG